MSGRKGVPLTEEEKYKAGNGWRGKRRPPFSEEWRRNIGLGAKGKNKGRKLPPTSEETRIKRSENKKGEKCNFWKGGVHNSPYPVDWTRTLRRAIRERDYYTCQLCKEPQGDTAFDIHHIDYDKNNCSSDNLITLCRSCHMKTNSNRNYWLSYFTNKV